ncbi:NAD-dependent epimerase/dehydratase family protein [Alicyclobacillus acidiphilus]|uniref:NAD-dependent epimerase/dehydratase family protein n=1 Tax=Alicyclobacillus acidiphilus TaxID=182455 RepID=UPI00082CA768|nr:NAD-dependent epimerase/dehydratase family protein [Alicyclobacillus acidiphilus]
MKILVTGGAGFIGSNVVDAYIEAGHDVVVVDLPTCRRENVHPKAKLYLADIRSKDLADIFAEERPDVVNHHAAQKSVPKSVQDPELDADVNILGLLNILQNSVRVGVQKVIFISSGGALSGDSSIVPTPEDIDPIMISPYAISKYVSEKYLYFYHVTHGLRYTSLRYANVYGPRQVPEGESGVVPIFMANLLDGRPSTLRSYADMPRGTTRDYVYVGDVARANVLALDKGDNQALNIGSGIELYIEDIYHAMEDVVGVQIPLIRASERVGDVRRSVLDCTRAKRELGWEPRTDLREGLRKTYEYFRQA